MSFFFRCVSNGSPESADHRGKARQSQRENCGGFTKAGVARTRRTVWQLARGIDENPVVSDRPIQSISVEDTFEEDLQLAETEPMIRWLAGEAVVGFAQGNAGALDHCAETQDQRVQDSHAQLYAEFTSVLLRRIARDRPQACGNEFRPVYSNGIVWWVWA